jgi:hypothetical protein
MNSLDSVKFAGVAETACDFSTCFPTPYGLEKTSRTSILSIPVAPLENRAGMLIGIATLTRCRSS